MAILDGTQFDPILPSATDPPLVAAQATATLAVQSVFMDTFGSGYVSAPSVQFADAAVNGAGANAQGTAVVNAGA